MDDPGVTSLAAGGFTTFTVTYAPSGAADRSDTVTISTDDPNGDYSVSVSGTGVRSLYGMTLLPSAYQAMSRRALG